MSYVYKYELRKEKEIKNFTYLERQVLNEIQNVAPIFFGLDLKDCHIYDNYENKLYIKFDLYSPLDISKAIKFGLFLKKKIPEYGKVVKLKKVNNVFYAIVYKESEEEIEVELVDEMAIENPNLFEERMEAYFSNDKISAMLNIRQYFPQDIKRNLFLSLLSCKVSQNKANLFRDIEEKNIYRIEGQIRSPYINNSNEISEKIFLTSEHDDFICKKFEFEYFNYKSKDYTAYLDISKCEKENIEKYKKIKKRFYINFESNNFINFPIITNHDELYFNVYNVGQALCTSLSINKQNPFFFFDFGHVNSKIMIDSKPIIVISHNHVDHWNGLRKYLKSNTIPKAVYLMDDFQKLQMNQVLIDLYLMGTAVYKINATVNLEIGYLVPVANMQDSNNVNSGIMYIDFRNKRVLVPGDQRYENISKKFLSNIDILVATHHGQTYGTHIPNNSKEDGIIIYSFKRDSYSNTYFPSKRKDYVVKDWKREVMTPDGDFEVSF